MQLIKKWFENMLSPSPKVALAFGQQALSLVYTDNDQKKHCVLIPRGGEFDVLSQMVEKKKLAKKACVCLLEPNQYQTFLLEKPKVPPQELKDALRWRLAELIDYPIQEACFDYLELPNKPGQDASMIYIVASKAQEVERISQQARQAGLKPKRVEIPETALRKYMNLKQTSRIPKVLVVFYEQYTYLIITKHQQLLLMRRLEASYPHIMTHDQVEAQSLALEIQRSLDYCSAHFADASHAQVLLDRLELPVSFQEALSAVLGMPVVSMETQKHLGLEYHNHNALFLHYAAMGALGGRP